MVVIDMKLFYIFSPLKDHRNEFSENWSFLLRDRWEMIFKNSEYVYENYNFIQDYSW